LNTKNLRKHALNCIATEIQILFIENNAMLYQLEIPKLH